MANILTFQTQIASVMEVLANAAVAEICKLVEDSYAELHLEISQTKKENNLLKKKLKTIEIRDSFYRRAHKLMNESTAMTRTSVHEKVSGKGDWNGNYNMVTAVLDNSIILNATIVTSLFTVKILCLFPGRISVKVASVCNNVGNVSDEEGSVHRGNSRLQPERLDQVCINNEWSVYPIALILSRNIVAYFFLSSYTV